MSRDIIEKPIKTISDAFEDIFERRAKGDCSDFWFDVESAKSHCESLLAAYVKQSRAEVLATCVAYLKMAGEEAIFTQHKQAYKNAALVVAELQPAAKALKELLWPGRELSKAVLEWETAMGVNEVSHENSRRIYDASAKMLEKAHAVEEKG